MFQFPSPEYLGKAKLQINTHAQNQCVSLHDRSEKEGTSTSLLTSFRSNAKASSESAFPKAAFASAGESWRTILSLRAYHRALHRALDPYSLLPETETIADSGNVNWQNSGPEKFPSSAREFNCSLVKHAFAGMYRTKPKVQYTSNCPPPDQINSTRSHRSSVKHVFTEYVLTKQMYDNHRAVPHRTSCAS